MAMTMPAADLTKVADDVVGVVDGAVTIVVEPHVSAAQDGVLQLVVEQNFRPGNAADTNPAALVGSTGAKIGIAPAPVPLHAA